MYNYLDEPDGSIKGGDPGIRLIEPVEGTKNVYLKEESKVIQVKKDEWLIVPVYQIFGSDELSSLGPSILQRIQEPFVLLNQKDADIITVNDGDSVNLEILKIKLIVKVKIDNNVVRGLAGLSVNLPGMPFIDIPGSGKFHKL
jgi:NADH-quinone oxidoreductase subunit G